MRFDHFPRRVARASCPCTGRHWRDASATPTPLVALVLSFLLLGPQAARAQGLPLADVRLGPTTTRRLAEHPTHRGHTAIQRQAKLLFGKVDYSIKYSACTDKSHAPGVAPIEGYLGMPEPGTCNWYHSGFLFLAINGRDIGTTPLSSMVAAERGDRAILDLVWHAPQASVRVRFVGLPGQDCLFSRIELEPNEEIRSIELRLTCYPSYFTSHFNRQGARRIRTPGALVEEGRTAKLPAKNNWWALYYDEVFDLSKGEGEGPCAMLLLPEQGGEISFNPAAYAVGTTIRYPAGARRLDLAFWDFKGLTNAEALARVKSAAERTRAELARADFTPQAVKTFDAATLRAELERAMRSPAVRSALGTKGAEVQTWLARYGPALEQKTGHRIEAEERLLESAQRYERFSWEVKLAELLSGL